MIVLLCMIQSYQIGDVITRLKYRIVTTNAWLKNMKAITRTVMVLMEI